MDTSPPRSLPTVPAPPPPLRGNRGRTETSPTVMHSQAVSIESLHNEIRFIKVQVKMLSLSVFLIGAGALFGYFLALERH